MPQTDVQVQVLFTADITGPIISGDSTLSVHLSGKSCRKKTWDLGLWIFWHSQWVQLGLGNRCKSTGWNLTLQPSNLFGKLSNTRKCGSLNMQPTRLCGSGPMSHRTSSLRTLQLVSKNRFEKWFSLFIPSPPQICLEFKDGPSNWHTYIYMHKEKSVLVHKHFKMCVLHEWGMLRSPTAQILHLFCSFVTAIHELMQMVLYTGKGLGMKC